MRRREWEIKESERYYEMVVNFGTHKSHQWIIIIWRRWRYHKMLTNKVARLRNNFFLGHKEAKIQLFLKNLSMSIFVDYLVNKHLQKPCIALIFLSSFCTNQVALNYMATTTILYFFINESMRRKLHSHCILFFCNM